MLGGYTTVITDRIRACGVTYDENRNSEFAGCGINQTSLREKYINNVIDRISLFLANHERMKVERMEWTDVAQCRRTNDRQIDAGIEPFLPSSLAPPS